MSKYWTVIPFHVVGEDEPRLAPMIDNLDSNLLLPSPGWFVPASHIDVRNIHEELDNGWAHVILDEM